MRTVRIKLSPGTGSRTEYQITGTVQVHYAVHEPGAPKDRFPIRSEGSFNFSGVLRTVDLEVSDTAKGISMWVEPYGFGSVKAPNQDLAVGVARYEDRLINDLQFEIIPSPLAFIVSEMNTNKHSSLVTGLRRNNDDERKHEAWLKNLDARSWYDPKRLAIRNPVGRIGEWSSSMGRSAARQYLFGRPVHKNEGAAGFLQDVVWFGGGEWDHKPIIRPIWGSRNRLGNDDRIYFYDQWSNLHYGYIAKAAGFAREQIDRGANAANYVDSGVADDPADVESSKAGYELYLDGHDVTNEKILEIIDLHPNWIHASRFPEK